MNWATAARLVAHGALLRCCSGRISCCSSTRSRLPRRAAGRSGWARVQGGHAAGVTGSAALHGALHGWRFAKGAKRRWPMYTRPRHRTHAAAAVQCTADLSATPRPAPSRSLISPPAPAAPGAAALGGHSSCRASTQVRTLHVQRCMPCGLCAGPAAQPRFLSPAHRRHFVAEAALLRTLCHPNIVQCIGVCMTGKRSNSFFQAGALAFKEGCAEPAEPAMHADHAGPVTMLGHAIACRRGAGGACNGAHGRGRSVAGDAGGG